MPPAVITTESLEFSYGAEPVLRGLSLSVEAGEVVCLLGPNGVGKTTLVEHLLGSLTPTAGSVRVLDTDPRRVGAAFWARVGLVQQNWTDHPKWRVVDQLEWIRAIQLTASPDVMGTSEVLNAVGLADKATSRLSRLSGGQRRIIDFAAALMGRPELLLMTTHHLAEAERIASRVLIMSRGRVIADGTVTALRERLGHDAEVTWVQDGEHHVHATAAPERFLAQLDLGAITDLTITRPTLEETYLALVNKEEQS